MVQVLASLYSFADAAEERIPGARRNRGQLKRESRKVLDVVRGLTIMTNKQLAAVSHLLPPGTIEAVGLAARLPRSNQGRKRQENLVAKMLRGQLTDEQLEKLEEAVELATERSGVFEDGDVSGLVAAWQEGLLADDKDVMTEVYDRVRQAGLDQQQLRELVRQCQQALREEEEQAAAALGGQQQGASSPGGGNNSSSGSDEDVGEGSNKGEDEEGEDLQAILAEAAARSRKGGAGKEGTAAGAAAGGRARGKRPEKRSRALLRSLGRMLKPLALADVGVQ